MTDACYPYGIMGLEWRILKIEVQALGARNSLDIQGWRKGGLHIFFRSEV